MPDLQKQIKAYAGIEQSPVNDYTTDTAWDRSEFTSMAYNGEAGAGTWIVRVPDGDVPNHAFGGTKYLGAHNVVKLTVGSNVMFRGRINANDVSRGPTRGTRPQERSVLLSDYNDDLRGIIVQNWVRPEETDVARAQGLIARFLSGDPRPSTNLNGSNYIIAGSNLVTLPAKTYSAVTPGEVLQEIALAADKEMFVDPNGNVHLHGHDYTGFDSPLRISDDLADLNSVTCVPIEPTSSIEQRDQITRLVSYYGDTETRFVEVGGGGERTDYWAEAYFDDNASNATEAEQNARSIVAVRHQEPVTYTITVGKPGTVPNLAGNPMTGDDIYKLLPGMRIQFKARAARGGKTAANAFAGDSFLTTHIRSVTWNFPGNGQPDSYYARLELEKPLRIHPVNRGTKGGLKFPPDCLPVPDDAVTELSNSTDDTWPGTLASSDSCWGGDTYRSANGAGGLGPSPSQAVSAGDVIRATLNFRNETGNDAWENTDGYNYDADLQFTGSGKPTLSYKIIDQRYHNAGCINVTPSRTETVPAGYTAARVKINSRLGGYKYYGTLSEVDAAEIPDNDPDCIEAGSGGDSPFPPRSDDPRFDNDDQHLITHLQQRVINSSGGTLQVGDVVIPDTTEDDPSVTSTTDAATTDAMVGIITTAGGDGEAVTVMWSGVFVRTLNVDGTPAVGDYLFTSTTAKAADVDGTRDTGAVGRVIAVDADDNTTFVLWWGAPDSGSGGGTGDHGALTGLADDDHPQYFRTTLGGRDVVNTVAASGTTETLDLASANFHDVTLSANCTLTLTGATNGVGCYMTILLRQDSTGSRTVTWPASVAWVGGSAPTLQTAANAWDLVSLVTRDGGTVWFADAGTAGGGSGAPTTADYLVGTAQGGLSAEIVVGTTPGGELGGTWASPTVDATHSGSAHHTESHQSRHNTGGADALKLDDLAAPDDNTDLNASTSAHGLLKKLPGGTSTYLRADGTFANPGGGTGGSTLGEGRPFISGQPTAYVYPGNVIASITAGQLGTGTRYYEPIIIQEQLDLVALMAECTLGAAAGRALRGGLYVADSQWIPGALVLEGAFDCSSTGVKTIAGGPTTLTPGRYLICMESNNATPTMRIWTMAGSMFSGTGSANALVVRLTKSGTTYGTLPDPGTAPDGLQQSNAPAGSRILLQVNV